MPTTITDTVSQISGLTLRLRADQITGLTDGASVTSWPDASGNGYDATAGAGKPVWKPAGLGGQPTVLFSSSASPLDCAASGNPATHTLVAVIQPAGTGIRSLIGSSSGNGLQLCLSSANQQQIVRQATAIVGTGTTTAPAGTPVILTYQWNAGTGAYALINNGTTHKTGTTTGTMGTGLTLRVGSNANSTEQWQGHIAELIQFNRVLSAAELSTVDTYIQNRYGITAADYSGTPALSSTTAPAVTGTPNPGQTLTCSTGGWSATPDSYSYQWNKAGTPISGATASTYPVVSGDVGSAITCTVTAAKSGYTSGSATSNAVTVTDPATTLTNTAVPVISGAAQVGSTLSTTNGSWSPTPDSYTYQWRRAGTAISGATGATYTLVSADQGSTITVTVTAAKSGYASQPATSAATSTVAAAPPGAIAPNDPGIVYSPYTWNVTGSVATTVCGGAYLRATIIGNPTSIVANFDVSTSGTRLVAISVDGQPATQATVAATVTITIPNSGWAKHTVELVFYGMYGTNLWNPPDAGVKFTGFTVQPNTVTVGATRRRPYNVLCFGDSITNGYATTNLSIIDSRLGWAYPLRDLLGAEVGVVGYNAQGFNKSGDGNVPAFGSTYDQLYTGVARSFTTPAEPHLILVNMGTNDGGDITANATTVLNGLLAATTTARIVVVQQWNGTGHRSQYQAAIAATTAPARITYLDTTGWWNSADSGDGLHPFGYINLTDLSPRLAAALLPLLTGSATPRRFINKAGTAVPIG